MLWLALNTFSFDEIKQPFIIRGHSKNVHAAIEKGLKQDRGLYDWPMGSNHANVEKKNSVNQGIGWRHKTFLILKWSLQNW